MKRWIIVKISALGDVIQTLDALGPFTSFFQKEGVELEWAADPQLVGLLQLHPLVRKVHSLPIKKWKKELGKRATWKEIYQSVRSLRESRYELALDLQGNTKSAIVMRILCANFKIGFDSQSASERPASWGLDLSLSKSGLKSARALYRYGFEQAFGLLREDLSSPFFSSFSPERLLWPKELLVKKREPAYGVIAFGSRWPTKQPDKHTASVCLQHLLKSSQEKLFLAFGNLEEESFARNLVEEISDPRLSLLAAMDLLNYTYTIYKALWIVSVDSLTLHLASWMGRPSFSLFGPSRALYYAPQGEKDSFWQGVCPYKLLFQQRCPYLRSCASGSCSKMGSQILSRLELWLQNLKGGKL